MLVSSKSCVMTREEVLFDVMMKTENFWPEIKLKNTLKLKPNDIFEDLFCLCN